MQLSRATELTDLFRCNPLLNDHKLLPEVNKWEKQLITRTITLRAFPLRISIPIHSDNDWIGPWLLWTGSQTDFQRHLHETRKCSTEVFRKEEEGWRWLKCETSL